MAFLQVIKNVLKELDIERTYYEILLKRNFIL